MEIRRGKVREYTKIHVHTDHSNPTTVADSTTSVEEYAQRAKEIGMTALAITEHGNVFEWTKKKRVINDAGLKYIHGIEAYVTETLDEKVRDNYHMVLLAKNYDGVMEINALSSKSFNRNDGSYYYNPRITLDDVINTSDNIFVSTACLGGVLNRGSNEAKAKLLKFMTENKDRCFLEIQHHDVEDQKEYNKMLYDIHKATGIPLVAATDTHSLTETHATARIALQHYKKTFFNNEDDWDLVFKTTEELIEAFDKQGALPKEVYMEAIANTNVIADAVEDFELNREHKYPKYENSVETFKSKIAEGLVVRNQDPEDPVIQERIRREFDAFKKTIKPDSKYGSAIDYLLLEEDIKSWCRANDVVYGSGRGSATGCYSAYLLRVHDINSIRHNLVFERFFNPERVSLADIDSDYIGLKRDSVKDYIHSKDYVYTSDIITFGTLAEKGALKAAAPTFGISSSEANEITKQLAGNEPELRSKYPELFELADLLKGTVTHSGTHAGGVLVSPIELATHVGISTNSKNPRVVSQISKDEVEYLNFVKLDCLVTTTTDILATTCELAEIPFLKPDDVDPENPEHWAVWESMREDTTGIFQWAEESGRAYLPELFSDDTIQKMKEYNPDIKLMDILSMGNGAIRPSGNSYRDDLAHAKVTTYGIEPLDDFLSNRLGKLIFQEDIIMFLEKFCGYSAGQADIVRRAIGDKDEKVLDELTQEITEGFIKTMTEVYNIDEDKSSEIIVDFIEVIKDAAGYGFSLNHSTPYSYQGYFCGYLRHYYTIEFLTAAFTILQDKQDDTAAYYQYMMKYTDIELSPPKFRYSRGDYFFSREHNKIYKGIGSISYINKEKADELFDLRENEYETFVDLLVDITENTTVTNKAVTILIQLDYFSEFGDANKLLAIQDEFINGKGTCYKKTYVEKTKEKRLAGLKEFERTVEYKPITSLQRAYYDIEYMGHTDISDQSYKIDVFIVATQESNDWGSVFMDLYRINNGERVSVRVQKHIFADAPVKKGEIIQVVKLEMNKPKWKNPDQTENLLTHYCVLEIDDE